MNQFSRDVGILKGDVPYEAVVATQFSHLWKQRRMGKSAMRIREPESTRLCPHVNVHRRVGKIARE